VMIFVPFQTPYLEAEASQAKQMAREFSVKPFDLAIPKLGRVSIMIFSAEGCEVCPLALAFAEALKAGSDIVENIYLVDCNACKEGALKKVCDSLATLPAIAIGRDPHLKALAGGEKPSGKLTFLLGFSQHGYEVLLDAILSFYISERYEVLEPYLTRIITAASSRGLTLAPGIITRKVFMAKLIKSIVEHGEARCPCRPAFKCPCAEGLYMAQRKGRCYCGYIVRRDGDQASKLKPLFTRAIQTIAMGIEMALMLDGDTEVDKSIVGNQRKLAAMLSIPTATISTMVVESCMRVSDGIDYAMRSIVSDARRYIVVKGDASEAKSGSEPREGI